VSKRYVGVDPGLVTGVAVYEPGQLFQSYEVTRPHIMNLLRQVVREGDVVCIEKFTISMQTVRKTRQPDALQIIGATQELCRLKGAQLIIQEPAPAKRIGSYEVLRKLDWHRLTKDNHANDAASFVLMALLKTNRAVYAELIGL
jgi:hypothetical protein